MTERKETEGKKETMMLASVRCWCTARFGQKKVKVFTFVFH